jgi:hypothetical protein
MSRYELETLANPDAVPVTGGNLDSRQQRWVEFLDDYDNKRNDLLRQIEDKEWQIECYDQALDLFRQEDGKLAQFVRYKYITKIKPDSVIWENHIFVSKPVLQNEALCGAGLLRLFRPDAFY